MHSHVLAIWTFARLQPTMFWRYRRRHGPQSPQQPAACVSGLRRFWTTRGRSGRATNNPARWRGHLDRLLPEPSRVRSVAVMRRSTGGRRRASWRLARREGLAAKALAFSIPQPADREKCAAHVGPKYVAVAVGLYPLRAWKPQKASSPCAQTRCVPWVAGRSRCIRFSEPC